MADFNGPKTRNHNAASCFSMDWEERRMAADLSEESSDVDNWIVEVCGVVVAVMVFVWRCLLWRL